MSKKLKLVSGIVSNVSAVLLGVCFAGNIMINDNAGNINRMLNIKTMDYIQADDDQNVKDSMYWKSDYKSISELQNAIHDTIAEVVSEGSVLLKNERNALPLSAKAKVSLFSVSSANMVYSGGGSSSAADRNGFTSVGKGTTVDLKSAMEEEGFTVNDGLWNFYKDNVEKYRVWQTSNTRANGATYYVNEAPWGVLPDSKTDKAEAAIFVIGRFGTEATDLYINTPKTQYNLTNGNYLELSPDEKDVLTNLKKQKEAGVFSKIIVLMNTATPVQCDFADDAAYGIDSLMWVGLPGSTGTKGIAKILSGKVNPSGSAGDTFWKKHLYNPLYANWGATSFAANANGMPGNANSRTYVVYQEGIYNGYRYTETRYEDYVLNTANVGEYDYSKAVSYPFGYGISYSTFEYSDFMVKYNAVKDEYTISVTVKNTGSVAGKEPVQIYLQKPYTEYDKKNHIEKSAVDLVGVAKTGILQPNKSEVVEIVVDGYQLASYDAYNAKTYIIDEGDYYFTAATDSHNAVNNVLEAKSKSKDITRSRMVGTGDADLTVKVNRTFDREKYSKSVTGATVTNQFDNVDLNIYKTSSNNSVEYISRSNWAGTAKMGFDESYNKLDNVVKVSADDEMIADAQPKVPTADSVAYPTYEAQNGLNLADLIGVEYDDAGNIVKSEVVDFNDELWDKLLDQLSWDDTVLIVANGFHHTMPIPSINKPGTIDHNGSLGPMESYDYTSNSAENRYAFYMDDPNASTASAQYPNAGLLATTLNSDLVLKLAKLKGEQCLWGGYTGVYGPGANMHRGAYGGRAFEYYSEDGFLAGFALTQECIGIQSKGAYVYMKHAVLNDQEMNREGLCTFANEQTIREIYLKPLEMAIVDGDAFGVMTGFNRLGVVWTGAQGFANTVLRNEFGMRGFNVSDYWQKAYMTVTASVLGGGDLPDGDDNGGRTSTNGATELAKYREGYGAFAQEMRKVAHRVLYSVAWSNAMNGMSSNTRVVYYTPFYKPLMNGLIISSAILLAISVATCVVLNLKEKH
ncbi:MAG: glycoside hydrolase family 3 C-terminal domain-containing protein [Clostridia bacterium]|nr:glycoside hydrolase family 3 C-terminal domain-containing protein [Clostridia bacterium]